MAFSREVRVGLVMYGGVSLAIYINGVAREFFEAVRGRGVYGLLKHLVDSDVTVDIVSGASAGGINGVFLCQALANDYDFARLASLWREHADIDRLLRPVGESTPPSLFDSEGYYQPRLEEAFADLEPCRPEPGEVPSPVEAIDLFVMGTDYHGARAFRPDALGSLLESKEHRAVFRLKHRRGRPRRRLRRRRRAGRAGRARPRAGHAVPADLVVPGRLLAHPRAGAGRARRARLRRAPQAVGLARARDLLHRRRRARQQAVHRRDRADLPPHRDAPGRPGAVLRRAGPGAVRAD